MFGVRIEVGGEFHEFEGQIIIKIKLSSGRGRAGERGECTTAVLVVTSAVKAVSRQDCVARSDQGNARID